MNDAHSSSLVEFNTAKAKLRHASVRQIRTAVDAVPVLGSVRVFLINDPNVVDAVYTLHSLGWRPIDVVRFVDIAEFTETIFLECLIVVANRQLTAIIRNNRG